MNPLRQKVEVYDSDGRWLRTTRMKDALRMQARKIARIEGSNLFMIPRELPSADLSMPKRVKHSPRFLVRANPHFLFGDTEQNPGITRTFAPYPHMWQTTSGESSRAAF